MIALADGTVLEKEYKGSKIKVVVKKGKYAFNGKLYEKRGALMKAITKGKVAQFTNFFGLAKEETNGEEKPAKKSTVAKTVTVEEGTIEGIIRRIVREEVKNIFEQSEL